jgi:hypothetical protein
LGVSIREFVAILREPDAGGAIISATGEGG